ncbi:putative MFS family arabinose efflux permease [Paraburkholderia unamae]|uniref:MFS transporter n=1 Tax=Paraburkholderia unamae TaxID=219649 RepID=UPI000DC33EF6|nr:MFS transporter [Paraburkholderia unamae]RAR65876.1 putative MFS family arabinose efflux permease [Paraburkholderia unamae]
MRGTPGNAQAPANAQRVIVNLSHASLAAQFSEQMAIAVIPIVAVVALGASAQQSATLQAVNTLPFLLLSLPAGLVADRSRRKPLMIATELLRAAALFVLFALFHARVLSLVTLGTLGFAIATGTVVFSVAAPSLVAAMVETGDLLTANRRLEIARSIAYTAGPAVGGVFAGWASGVFAFLAAFALSLASAWCLARLPAETPRPRARRALVHELFDGVQFIARSTHLRPIVATAFVFNTSWYLLLAVFAWYAIHRLAFAPSAVGVALGVYGFGMVGGAFLYQAIAKRLVFGRQILLGPMSAALASVLMASTVFTHSRATVFLAFFLFGFGPIVWTISTTALRQVVTPRDLIARVSSVIMMATFGARPLGAMLGAFLSTRFGMTSCLVGAACGFAAQLAIIVLSAPARLRSIESLEAARAGQRDAASAMRLATGNRQE